jgi:hypothetical protein
MINANVVTRPLRKALGGLPFSGLPLFEAQASAATGITGGSGAGFLFAIAAALILTLVFRAAAKQFLASILAKIGAIRVRRVLKAEGSTVLHDLVLPGAYGGLVKIDHAVRISGGVLCILTMPSRGLIFGRPDEPQWSNVNGTLRHRFLNPLIENESQVRALQATVPGVPVTGVVIFTGHVEFSCTPPPNVMHVSRLHKFLASPVFDSSSVEDWDAVWLTIRSAGVTNAASLKSHPAKIA